MVRPGRTMSPLTCAFTLERVTGIEPALSAWEAVPSGPVTWPDLRGGVSASDRERPLVTGVNGPLMARRTVVRPALIAVPWSSPSSSIAADPRPGARQSSSEEDGTTGLEGCDWSYPDQGSYRSPSWRRSHE